jgi:hypothetical protein
MRPHLTVEQRQLAAAYQPGQRRRPELVGMIPPQATAELTAQHLVLMAQHQQLDVLGQVRADQHRQQAEQAPHQAVGKRQQDPEMVPATLPIPQQNPSSHHETEFPSGTRWTRTSAILILPVQEHFLVQAHRSGTRPSRKDRARQHRVECPGELPGPVAGQEPEPGAVRPVGIVEVLVLPHYCHQVAPVPDQGPV